MKGPEWWAGLLGQMDAYDGETAEDVTRRISELGYDAEAMYIVAFTHASKEPGVDADEAHSNAAWMCFGIELGIRAERALKLEEGVT